MERKESRRSLARALRAGPAVPFVANSTRRAAASRNLLARLIRPAVAAFVLAACGVHAQNSSPDLPPAFRGVDPGMLSSGLAASLFGATEPTMPPGTARQTQTMSTAPGANTQLGADPAALPSTLRAQAEPHIARSFFNPDLVIATFQEGRFTDGGAVTCGYAVSTDAGGNWTRQLIPKLATVNGGSYDRATDPVAGVSHDGIVYLNTLGIRGDGVNRTGHIVLSKSLDKGATFGEPLPVYPSNDPNIFPDKNWMAVDSFPQSPHAGRIAVTFTLFTNYISGSTKLPIVSTISNDQGATWSPIQIISPSLCQGSQPVFLPDGALAVIYWNFGPNFGDFSDDRIEMAFSADGGKTFAAPRVVTRVAVYDAPFVRDGMYLCSATADREGGILYVAYQAFHNGVPAVLCTRSIDRGVSWSTPVKVSDTPAGKPVFNAAVAASPDGQHVTVIFYDGRHDPGGLNFVDLYIAESFDGGTTWEPNRRVSTTSTDIRLAPDSDGRGKMLGDYQGVVSALSLEKPGFAVWIDTRTGSPDPFAASLPRSKGTTFETWRTLRFTASERLISTTSGAEADPDADTLPNLLEYALGLDPKAASARPFTATKAVERFSPVLRLGFEQSAVATDVAVNWSGSTDLDNWARITPEFRAFRPGLLPWLRGVEDTFQMADYPVRFFRLEAQRLPPLPP